MEKICVFCGAYYNSGISQYALTLANTYKNLGYNVSMVIPETNDIVIPEVLPRKYYHIGKRHVFIGKYAKSIASWIEIEGFDFVFFTDNSNFTTRVIPLLKTVMKVVTIHDVYAHSSYSGFDERLKLAIIDRRMRSVLNVTDAVVLLSKNSFDNFIKRYPKYEAKAVKMNLGAHVPLVSSSVRPYELDAKKWNNYLLFFGRIDKYKGVANLIEAYSASRKKLGLVVAGRNLGLEMTELDGSKGIVTLYRFVSNEEMVWLFEHAKFCILPYMDATQSGVLPIAYKFRVPVIASDVAGLNEFIVDGKTGFLIPVGDITALYKAVEMCYDMTDEEYVQLQANIDEYFNLKFNWNRNLTEAMNEIESKYSSK